MPNAPYAIVEAPPTLRLATAGVVAQGCGRVVVLGGAAAYDRVDDGVGHGDSQG